MSIKTFKPDDSRVFEITTVSGTIYKLSAPDARLYRTIRRMMAGYEKGGSVIMTDKQEEEKEKMQMKGATPAHKTFFKGRLTEPVHTGKPLVIEIFGENRTLISEVVREIEAK